MTNAARQCRSMIAAISPGTPHGPVAGDPLTQESLMCHPTTQLSGQVVAEQMPRAVAAVVREMVGEKLRLGR